MAEWQNGAEWQKEWQNGRTAGMDTYVLGGNGGNGGMAGMAEMAEWRNGGMAEWRTEWRYGGKNGRIAEWQKWLHTYYLRYTHTDDNNNDFFNLL